MALFIFIDIYKT